MAGETQTPAVAAPGTPEYEAQMAQAGSTVPVQAVSPDGTAVQNLNPAVETKGETEKPAPATDRPAWLPEEFKTPEDMVKAYSELKSGNQKPNEQAKDSLQVEEDPQVPKLPDGLDITKYENEWFRNGGLSPESYADLEKKGISKEMVDAYVKGQEALQQARTQEGFNEVGGRDKYEQMVEWAKANLTPAEKAAFNSQVSSQSKEAALLAIRGLYSKYEAAAGRSPNLLNGGSATPSGSTNGFQSRQQVVDAMSDPRYETDPAYRKSVMDRLAVTADTVL